MCKEDFKEMKKNDTSSEITISDKGCTYPIMTIYFFLNQEKKINHTTQFILRSFDENFGLRDFDITVKHNKKSINTKEEEKKALFEFLGELTK